MSSAPLPPGPPLPSIPGNHPGTRPDPWGGRISTGGAAGSLRNRNVSMLLRIPRSSDFLRIPALMTLVMAAGLTAVTEPAAGQDSICPERYEVSVDGGVLALPYCSSMPVGQPNPAVRRIVFSIHGVATNATTYYANMVAAAERVPGAMEETLIIGPKLMTRAFADGRDDLLPNDIFWNTSSDRFWGGESGSSERNPRSVAISSFEVFDRFLADLLRPGLFPNLEIVVLAGHSGGGQFMNRFAMASPFEDQVARPRGVHVRYVVGQPSTHTYLTNVRVDLEDRTRQTFRVPGPEETESCAAWNRYGSGLEGLDGWDYMERIGAPTMLERYRERDVIYLHGMDDSDPQDSQLARGCAAMMQGFHRLDRGITYFNYVNHLYGEGNHNHRIAFVPRVGHDHARMWASEPGLLHIFDHAVTLAEGPGRGR
jgi:hypothetical protein